MKGTTTINSAQDVAKAVAENTENVILMGLQDLVKRGLLVVESGPVKLARKFGAHNYEFEIMQEVKLMLKDQEYIEKLENENKKLREAISELKLI